MKDRNIWISTDHDEPGYCVYCDNCGVYLYTSPQDPSNLADDLCDNCLDEKFYREHGGYLAEGI